MDSRNNTPASPETLIPDQDKLRYDSFVVRIWHYRSANTLHRAEVRHCQVDETVHATDVQPGWILRAMDRFLNPERVQEYLPDRDPD